MIHMMNYILITIMSINFLNMNHPLAMGLTLLIQTILICMISGLMAKSFWFSYILFLIFLGGMLILFIYVTSLASNEMFSISSNLIMISTIMLIISSIVMFMSDNLFSYTPFINNEMIEISNMNSYLSENSLDLYKMYNMPTNYITILLINYLLIALIAIVKITNIFQGPLRTMN